MVDDDNDDERAAMLAADGGRDSDERGGIIGVDGVNVDNDADDGMDGDEGGKSCCTGDDTVDAGALLVLMPLLPLLLAMPIPLPTIE